MKQLKKSVTLMTALIITVWMTGAVNASVTRARTWLVPGETDKGTYAGNLQLNSPDEVSAELSTSSYISNEEMYTKIALSIDTFYGTSTTSREGWGSCYYNNSHLLNATYVMCNYFVDYDYIDTLALGV